MATSANSVMSNHSPRNSGDAPAVNSPQAKQSAGGRGALSPWMQAVRGSEAESVVDMAPSSPLSPAKASASSTAFSADDSTPDANVQMEGADNGSGINNAGKKPVWNKPSNGLAEAGAVMGASSWPPLSESARASPKASASDPLKVVTDGLVSLSQGTGMASPVSQKKTITNNANVSLTSNHGTTTRQKSTKRGSGGGSSSGSGLQSPVPTLDQSGVDVSPSVGKPNSVVVEPSSHSKETTVKESGQKGSGLVSQSSPGGNNDHHPQQQRSSFRRGNAGSHPRGDGSYHHNHGGRRDHSGNNHDWNPHRSFNGRDMQMQSPRGVPRGFMRNPPPNSAFVPPPPPPLHVRPYGGPVVYSEVPPPVIYVPAPPPDSLRGVPLVASPMSPHPMFYLTDPQLHARIVGQIDYYFSNENLVKDTFLRMNMDDQGWVPIRLIAGFKKVMMLTDNIQFILDALHSSTIVEIQGERVRRRNDWSKWIMRPSSSPSSSSLQISSPQSGGPDMIFAPNVVNMQNLALDEYNATTGNRTNEEGGAAGSSKK